MSNQGDRQGWIRTVPWLARGVEQKRRRLKALLEAALWPCGYGLMGLDGAEDFPNRSSIVKLTGIQGMWTSISRQKARSGPGRGSPGSSPRSTRQLANEPSPRPPSKRKADRYLLCLSVVIIAGILSVLSSGGRGRDIQKRPLQVHRRPRPPTGATTVLQQFQDGPKCTGDELQPRVATYNEARADCMCIHADHAHWQIPIFDHDSMKLLKLQYRKDLTWMHDSCVT